MYTCFWSPSSDRDYLRVAASGTAVALPHQPVRYFAAELCRDWFYQIKPTFCSDPVSVIYTTTSSGKRYLYGICGPASEPASGTRHGRYNWRLFGLKINELIEHGPAFSVFGWVVQPYRLCFHCSCLITVLSAMRRSFWLSPCGIVETTRISAITTAFANDPCPQKDKAVINMGDF